ncbi:MAG: DNA topoisomerase (ATP-hydrolyzing) subunit B [Candidatus Cloacimonetes bacterium]|nr:DNA topoisomerase (ATP-hydrolyzing) subunit B [Candidatus Cloacimonadota bacterium]MBL7086080.1 DNA topoisomerase (ATP-hydrolyzing) subunit B [Candidatus Cloacimonadota bacterium]
MSAKYDATKIKVLKGLSAVRKRPSMYIGGIGERGLHHLVFEVVDNSIDEAMSGFCSKIDVIINTDGSILIKDNGRGIPVGMHIEQKVPAVQVVMTMLHAGGKFDDKTYKVAGGLHGVGVSVVNALSKWLEVKVYKKNKIYRQCYEKGEVKSKLEVIGKTKETGTDVTFIPDDKIFETTEFSFDLLSQRLRELSFLNKGLEINILDKRTNKKHNFKYEGGITSFVKYLNESKIAIFKTPIYIAGERDDIQVEAAIQYTESYHKNIFSYANNINTIEGGSHLTGFKLALTRALNKYIKDYQILKKEKITVSGDDIREGVTAVISVKLPNPQFEGQTKTKLVNTDVEGIVNSLVGEKLSDFFEENPTIVHKMINKALIAARSRAAAQKAKEITRRKGLLDSGTLPLKLADCSSKEPEICELFLVEGDSAGGSAKQGRDRRFQAILPLWGKMLNVEKARIDKVLTNDKLEPIISAIGAGIYDEFDVSKTRYHKIIIMADADVDGAHIATLILTFFFRYMKPLIEYGYVFIAKPPLYKIKKGKAIKYAFSDEERNRVINEFGNEGIAIQRYKGLGEMNPDQLWETTLDPERRTLVKIMIEDEVEADRTFDILMGSQVEARRQFIVENAKYVQDLDV